MAYISEFVNALKDKPLSGLFVDGYFRPHKVLNTMVWGSKAIANAATGFSVTVVRDQKVEGSAKARAWGSNYEVKNANPKPETYYLAAFGGAYQVDQTQDELAGGILSENEARSKMAHSVSEFARQFIKGTGTNNEFIGLNKMCEDNNLKHAEVFDIATAEWNADTAFKFNKWFRNVLKNLNVDANRIYCSRNMAANLLALQDFIRSNVTPVTIESMELDRFLGIAICDISEDLTEAVDGGIAENIFVAKVGTEDLYCAAPTTATAFIKTQKPVNVGQPLAVGSVEFVTCPVLKNLGALVKAQVITDAE